MNDRTNASRQQASWIANAAAWTTAVRGGQIASRRSGTDAAIVDACQSEAGMRILDVGCGEGWLARALSAQGAQVTGVDASEPLIAAARTAGGATYEVADYALLSAQRTVVPGPFDVIVCNFALLDRDLVPLLRALSKRLALSGRLLIQTVHPFIAAGPDGYVDGWREERFSAFGDGFSAPMPWYFRTFESWQRTLWESGLTVYRLREPRNAEGAVLSLLFECQAASG
ncbi:MAG: methyltransferase domain-containing protein [Gemmatimonadaceae bacterium]|nr:methyltransferase domain-containing protein [Gemmatimonadaceae bacterium]